MVKSKKQRPAGGQIGSFSVPGLGDLPLLAASLSTWGQIFAAVFSQQESTGPCTALGPASTHP